MGNDDLQKAKNKIADFIEKADSLYDLQKIDNDIIEGRNLLKSYNYFLKQIYINRINNEYPLYVLAMNEGLNYREKSFGNNSTRHLSNLDENISQLLKMLLLAKYKKLFGEIEKMMKFEQNLFMSEILTNNDIDEFINSIK